MLDRSQISACLVSREPIDSRILKSLEGFGEIVVGDGTHGVCARYEAVANARFDIVYTQDDDCLVDISALLRLWNGNFIANMMPDRLEPCFNNMLVGWGSLFKKELVQPTLDRYTQKYGIDPLFRREADRIFASCNEHPLVSVRIENLPNATGPNRLGDHPSHKDYRAEARSRVETLLGRRLQ